MTHDELVTRLAKPGSAIREEITENDCALIHAAMGIAKEAGELVDAVSRIAFYRKLPDRENLVEELGDIEFFLEEFRQACGIARLETIKHNIEKLSKRYEGVKYSDAAANARADKTGKTLCEVFAEEAKQVQ